MKLIGNYSEDIRNLIQGSDQYSMPDDLFIPDPEVLGEPRPTSQPEDYNVNTMPPNFAQGTQSPEGQWVWDGQSATWNSTGTFSPPIVFNPKYKIRLSVFENALFQEEYNLELNKDFYIKNGEIYLRPNELLDSEGYFEGNYTLQFDFIQRYEGQTLYLAETSTSRKEIRLRFNETDASPLPQVDDVQLTNFLNENSNSTNIDVEPPSEYKFNSFIELTGGTLIPINNYAFDVVTNGVDGRSVILKLNRPLPAGIRNFTTTINIVNKFLESQTEDIYFVDKDQTAEGNSRGLEINRGYLTETTAVDDDVSNYNDLVTGSLDIVSELKQNKKDINLNIDFSNFKNHVFFGSAVRKLENFRDKVVKLEGLYNQLSASLQISSSDGEVKFRQELFDNIRKEKESFTAYERFMYNDNQQTTINSAPGLGPNLAGNNFKNTYISSDTNYYRILSGSNAEGFEKLHNKSGSNDFVHLFTDNFNVEQPPFFNTNDFVYLSFVLRNTGSVEQLHISGGLSNNSFNSDVPSNKYKSYKYRRQEPLPFNTFSGSVLMNPTPTGSHYKRYIFKSQQNYFRPEESVFDLFDVTDYGASSTEIEVLSGSNIQSASTVGGIGDGFAYGIRDSSGQQTQYIFPSVVDQNNLSNTFEFITGSFLPQGDLFPVFINEGTNNSFFTDVRVSYKDPTNVQPFSTIYRPPSGSYDGSDEWNNWYTAQLSTASLYDTNNVHSLVNNLPLTLREGDDHAVLRNFVNMLGEQFDLLRNYIDNYLNFYKLGYTNPNSMPDNLLPVLGDAVGWELLNTIGGSSIEDYATSTAGDEFNLEKSFK